MDSRIDFLRHLHDVPAVLFLGQRHLALETGVDPVLSEILKKYGGQPPTQRSSYRDIFDTTIAQDPSTSLAWVEERCRRISPSAGIANIAMLMWSAIYSSAIDSVWYSCLRSCRASQRTIQPVLDERYRPLNPRNRFNLHSTFLFGSVSYANESNRPPLTVFEFIERRLVATSLARRIPETVTPQGILVIEGYSPDDWLAPEDLYAIINQLNPGQAHVFSANEDIVKHPVFVQLSRIGKATLHRESLAEALLHAENNGLMPPLPANENEEAGHHLSIGDTILSVPHSTWSRVSRSAMVLDDNAMAPPPPLSDDARYREFRQFIAVADGVPRWSGFERRFAFERRFEKPLRERTRAKLAAKDLSDQPLILHGQTGTGKTVALGALAHAIQKEHRYPVLYIERRNQRPYVQDVDEFCRWAEDAGCAKSLIIWDGMMQPEDYSAFLRHLTGRGRKVVLVGSCYKQATSASRTFVEAPAHLIEEESEQFLRFLDSFVPGVSQRWSRDMLSDPSFLVALYRLLPDTRRTIRHGVVHEVGTAEDTIAQNVKLRTSEQVRGHGTLANALLSAGLIKQEELDLSLQQEIGGEQIDDIRLITGLVMVPGRFGLKVPLEVLLRALGKDSFRVLASVLKGVDIFEWYEDRAGNIEIGARNALEAELLVQARFGGARTEIELASRLILEIRDDSDRQEDREVRFCVDLARAMGPNGRHSNYFEQYYRDVATILRKLREERGVLNPRIMLQEANLLREWARLQNIRNTPDVEAICADLEYAEMVLRKALELISDQKVRELRSRLLVELASALATMARVLIERNIDIERARVLFSRTQECVFQSRTLDAANYIPIDVLTWSTIEMLKSPALKPLERVEAIASLMHTFTTADPSEFTDEQHDSFGRRRMEAGKAIGDAQMVETAFAELAARGSGAGFYLRALELAHLPTSSDDLHLQHNLRAIGSAFNYLHEHREVFRNDARCVELMLDLWLMKETRSKLFELERYALPISADNWRQLLSLVETVQSTGASHRPLVLAFLKAICLFHIGNIERAMQLFKEVEMESYQVRGKRRVLRYYVASNADGTPREYHGTVAWVSQDGSGGEVYVEELRRKLPFVTHDFGGPNIHKGDTLGTFHIAFNYLGPLADPKQYYRRRVEG